MNNEQIVNQSDFSNSDVVPVFCRPIADSFQCEFPLLQKLPQHLLDIIRPPIQFDMSVEHDQHQKEGTIKRPSRRSRLTMIEWVAWGEEKAYQFGVKTSDLFDPYNAGATMFQVFNALNASCCHQSRTPSALSSISL